MYCGAKFSPFCWWPAQEHSVTGAKQKLLWKLQSVCNSKSLSGRDVKGSAMLLRSAFDSLSSDQNGTLHSGTCSLYQPHFPSKDKRGHKFFTQATHVYILTRIFRGLFRNDKNCPPFLAFQSFQCFPAATDSQLQQDPGYGWFLESFISPLILKGDQNDIVTSWGM